MLVRVERESLRPTLTADRRVWRIADLDHVVVLGLRVDPARLAVDAPPPWRLVRWGHRTSSWHPFLYTPAVTWLPTP